MSCVVVEGASSVAHAGGAKAARGGWGQRGGSRGELGKLRELRSVNSASTCLGLLPWPVVCAAEPRSRLNERGCRDREDASGLTALNIGWPREDADVCDPYTARAGRCERWVGGAGLSWAFRGCWLLHRGALQKGLSKQRWTNQQASANPPRLRPSPRTPPLQPFCAQHSQQTQLPHARYYQSVV